MNYKEPTPHDLFDKGRQAAYDKQAAAKTEAFKLYVKDCDKQKLTGFDWPTYAPYHQACLLADKECELELTRLRTMYYLQTGKKVYP